MSSTVTAIFDTREEAEAALFSLEKMGVNKDQVTMLVSEDTRRRHFGFVESTKAEEGATAGAAVGGLIGAIYMGLASAGTLVVPGLNLIASGALVSTLAGLGTGTVTGGLIGALIGMGIPEHEAKLFEAQVRSGSILLAVEASDDEMVDPIKDLLKEANAQRVTSLAA